MRTVAEMVKNKSVKFKYFRDNALWYETECGFLFPVPLTETGTATFLSTDKALFFMRWIRKYHDEINKLQSSNG